MLKTRTFSVNEEKGGKMTTIYSYSLMFFMFMFLLPKSKINAKSKINVDHAAIARTQQSDIQVLQLRSEQFSATPIQLVE